mmetsp:Transcript_29207/g.93415  ORF Transcript_29207/g.93415 Transcript_29207/m.93415 type:complete len:255 (+) Transcript_29207:593-1357(+)
MRTREASTSHATVLESRVADEEREASESFLATPNSARSSAAGETGTAPPPTALPRWSELGTEMERGAFHEATLGRPRGDGFSRSSEAVRRSRDAVRLTCARTEGERSASCSTLSTAMCMKDERTTRDQWHARVPKSESCSQERTSIRRSSASRSRWLYKKMSEQPTTLKCCDASKYWICCRMRSYECASAAALSRRAAEGPSRHPSLQKESPPGCEPTPARQPAGVRGRCSPDAPDPGKEGCSSVAATVIRSDS